MGAMKAEQAVTRSDVEEIVEGIVGRVGRQIIDDLGQRMQEMMTVIGVNHQQLEARFDRLEARFDNLEASHNALGLKVDELSRRVQHLEVRMVEISQGLTRLEARVKKMEGRVEALESDIRDFGKALSQVQKKLELISGSAEGERRSLARQVIALEKWALRIGNQAGVAFVLPPAAKN